MATAVEAKPAAEAVPAVAAAEKSPVEKVIVHPLVLLSVVDHFNRMGKVGHSKRVMGLLLGSWSSKGVLDISNREPSGSIELGLEVWFGSLVFIQRGRRER